MSGDNEALAILYLHVSSAVFASVGAIIGGLYIDRIPVTCKDARHLNCSCEWICLSSFAGKILCGIVCSTLGAGLQVACICGLIKCAKFLVK
jgi:hypothetical protein